MELEWITTQEAGSKWGVKARHVQALCAKGRISGVVRLGRTWLIPKNATKPTDGRVHNGRVRDGDTSAIVKSNGNQSILIDQTY
ncbi:MAG: helix-turn-helix domain-containing protein [Defluviitaleaceae bacterium]|nr:helix-turn-helix domain-containing protein [Defluviitaleaceae bacterium]